MEKCGRLKDVIYKRELEVSQKLVDKTNSLGITLVESRLFLKLRLQWANLSVENPKGSSVCKDF